MINTRAITAIKVGATMKSNTAYVIVNQGKGMLETPIRRTHVGTYKPSISRSLNATWTSV